jgi:hypothetical protein
MKVIIAGSRDFNDYEELKTICDSVIGEAEVTAIISGTARGADKLGEKYAKERGYNIERFPADWDKHGKAAGFVRNMAMAEAGDKLIAFWDGESVGTRHMIRLATERGIPFIHIFIKSNYGGSSEKRQ